MMIPLTLPKLVEHFQKKGLNIQHQKETDQAVIVLKIGDREYPLFLRIFEGSELLQLLAFLPCNIQPAAVGDTGRLLHLLNKEIDIPGFGMDEETAVVFYRVMVPVQQQQLDDSLLDAFINAIQTVCKSFSPVIAAVAYGSATFAEVLKKSREQSGKKSITQSQLRFD